MRDPYQWGILVFDFSKRFPMETHGRLSRWLSRRLVVVFAVSFEIQARKQFYFTLGQVQEDAYR